MTEVINIDAFKEEAPLKIKAGGVEHEMASPSIQTVLDNLNDLEELAKAPDVRSELNLTVRMIVRAFPTLTEEGVKSWPLPMIEKLFNTVRGGDAEATVQETDAQGNGQAAS